MKTMILILAVCFTAAAQTNKPSATDQAKIDAARKADPQFDVNTNPEPDTTSVYFHQWDAGEIVSCFTFEETAGLLSCDNPSSDWEGSLMNLHRRMVAQHKSQCSERMDKEVYHPTTVDPLTMSVAEVAAGLKVELNRIAAECIKTLPTFDDALAVEKNNARHFLVKFSKPPVWNTKPETLHMSLWHCSKNDTGIACTFEATVIDPMAKLSRDGVNP